MIGWVLLAVYVIGYLPCWRAIAYYIACDESGKEVPDRESLLGGLLLGAAFALLWPPIALGICVLRVYRWREDTVAALIVPRSVLRRVELDREEGIKS